MTIPMEVFGDGNSGRTDIQSNSKLSGTIYAPVIYFTPQGRRLNQSILQYYASLPRVILLCGHYKEIDQRAGIWQLAMKSH